MEAVKAPVNARVANRIPRRRIFNLLFLFGVFPLDSWKYTSDLVRRPISEDSCIPDEFRYGSLREKPFAGAAVPASVAPVARHVASFAPGWGLLPFSADNATSAAGLRNVGSASPKR
jgi:hypothetical protein